MEKPWLDLLTGCIREILKMYKIIFILLLLCFAGCPRDNVGSVTAIGLDTDDAKYGHITGNLIDIDFVATRTNYTHVVMTFKDGRVFTLKKHLSSAFTFMLNEENTIYYNGFGTIQKVKTGT